MKTLFPKIFTGLLMVVLMSCEDDAEKVTPERAVIQFQDVQSALQENSSEGTMVWLSLDRTMTTAGTVTLEIDESMAQRIETVPAHTDGIITLPVSKGAGQLKFTVKPVNNSVKEGNQTILISLQTSAGFVLGDKKSFQLTIEEDDNGTPIPNHPPSVYNFVEQLGSVSEGAGDAIQYKIVFAPAVSAESKIEIAITSAQANAFTTSPASVNNIITLLAPAGTTELSFFVTPVNNTDINGSTEVEFSVVSTEGPLVGGTRLKQNLTITDDELAGKIKSYVLNGGDGSEKRTYEYDNKGRIAKIITERFAPFNPTTLTDTYYYDDQDRVIKVNLWLGRDLTYTWNNGRIERVDVYQDNVLIQYANYAYDDHGNVAGVEPFYKQSNGEFKRGLFQVYLYFTNGNVYKALTYNDSPNSEEPVLITTRTYDQYLEATAPIAMFEILPTVKVQKNLAGSYRIENHSIGSDLTYQITYEFRPDGLPSKRIASAPGDVQTVTYQYY